MATKKLAVLYVSQEIALDFSVIQVLDCIMDNIKPAEITELSLFYADSEKYYLVSDFDS